jgi:hypothetical protein
VSDLTKENALEVGKFLNFGLENAKKHFLTFFGVIIVGAIAVVLLFWLGNKINPIVGFLLYLVGLIGLSFGVVKTTLALGRGESFNIADFIPDPLVLLNLILGSIIMSITVMIGLVLLVIPGVILSMMLIFVPYLIIDKKMGAIGAIKESIRLTSGRKMDILVGTFVIYGVGIFFSLLIIPIFLTIPMIAFGYAYPYIVLVGKDNVEQAVE